MKMLINTRPCWLDWVLVTQGFFSHKDSRQFFPPMSAWDAALIFSAGTSFFPVLGLFDSCVAPADLFSFLNLCTYCCKFSVFNFCMILASLLVYILYRLPSVSYLCWKIIWGYIDWFWCETSFHCCVNVSCSAFDQLTYRNR